VGEPQAFAGVRDGDDRPGVTDRFATVATVAFPVVEAQHGSIAAGA
jgi:hypothetical protein